MTGTEHNPRRSRRDPRPVILADLATNGRASWVTVGERTGMARETVRNQMLGMRRPLLGWVESHEVGYEKYEWTITDAGRVWLAEQTEEAS